MKSPAAGCASSPRIRARGEGARDRTKRAGFLLSLNSPNSALGRFSESTYLELADWTGRQFRKGKRGTIPEHISPSLERLKVNTQLWGQDRGASGSLFHRLVAPAFDMAKAARRQGRKWFCGVAACREFYKSKTQVV